MSPSNGDRRPTTQKMTFDKLSPEEKTTYHRLKKQFATRKDGSGKPIDYTPEMYVSDYQLG